LTKSEQTRRNLATPREEKNSSRWEKLALDVSRDLPEGVEAIHLMDQEADDYNVFSALRNAGARFVIRVASHRLTADNVRTSEVLAAKTAQFFRKVQVSPRSRKKAKRQHPERVERTAELCVRASTVTLKRPYSSPDAQLETLSLSAVHVFEVSPPPGEPPLEWMLFTSEPIGTLEDLEAIIDHYRGRWVIEEYFKALKTGCAFEKRQLCSFDALVRALGLFAPMAWTLLALRTLGREKTQRSATHVFNAEQLRLLRALLTKRRRTLVNEPTVRDAMLGIAALGGHIKNNGDPGWLVLGRGLRRFSEAEEVWALMREEM
jgi:DDE family transposase